MAKKSKNSSESTSKESLYTPIGAIVALLLITLIAVYSGGSGSRSTSPTGLAIGLSCQTDADCGNAKEMCYENVCINKAWKARFDKYSIQQKQTTLAKLKKKYEESQAKTQPTTALAKQCPQMVYECSPEGDKSFKAIPDPNTCKPVSWLGYDFCSNGCDTATGQCKKSEQQAQPAQPTPAPTQPVAATSDELPEGVKCLDGDNGINLGVKGKLLFAGGKNNPYWDMCVKGSAGSAGAGTKTSASNYVYEYYCNGDQAATVVKTCPAGSSCSDGACNCNGGVYENEKKTCLNDKAVQTTGTDKCTGETKVVTSSECPANQVCENGACKELMVQPVAAPTCVYNAAYDYTGDGYVGVNDQKFLTGVVSSKVCPSGKICDFNGDGKISSGDLQGFVNVNQPCLDAVATNPSLEKSVCGNNFLETGEVCDGFVPTKLKTCPAVTTGTVTNCKADCSGADTSVCVSPPKCTQSPSGTYKFNGTTWCGALAESCNDDPLKGTLGCCKLPASEAKSCADAKTWLNTTVSSCTGLEVKQTGKCYGDSVCEAGKCVSAKPKCTKPEWGPHKYGSQSCGYGDWSCNDDLTKGNVGCCTNETIAGSLKCEGNFAVNQTKNSCTGQIATNKVDCSTLKIWSKGKYYPGKCEMLKCVASCKSEVVLGSSCEGDFMVNVTKNSCTGEVVTNQVNCKETHSWMPHTCGYSNMWKAIKCTLTSDVQKQETGGESLLKCVTINQNQYNEQIKYGDQICFKKNGDGVGSCNDDPTKGKVGCCKDEIVPGSLKCVAKFAGGPQTVMANQTMNTCTGAIKNNAFDCSKTVDWDVNLSKICDVVDQWNYQDSKYFSAPACVNNCTINQEVVTCKPAWGGSFDYKKYECKAPASKWQAGNRWEYVGSGGACPSGTTCKNSVCRK